MGTAGLDVKRLSGLLERMKVECVLAQDDRSWDHCILRLSSVKRPNVVALVEYENDGTEPRHVGMMLSDEDQAAQLKNGPIEWEYDLTLSGAIKTDPDKIAEWIATEFL